MAKKKKAEEHENLERWLVSYADFMTLLFATFVVLYALAQIDIKEFDKLEESIKAAFNNTLPIDGGQNVMDGNGENILSQGASMDNNAIIPPMMEYLSLKYEKGSMEDIKKQIEKELKNGNIQGVSANVTDRGLVITLNDINIFFKSGSAQLTPTAQKTIDTLGAMIKKKFNNHLIRIEGHTDNLPNNPNSIYPSNWELSSARSSAVARFLISRHSIKSNLFTVVGYGDTKPIDTNATPQGREKNRRIEIVILKNQVAKYEPDGSELISPRNNPALPAVKKRKAAAKKNGLSDAAQELLYSDDKNSQDNVIILDEYNKNNSQKIKEAIDDFESGKIEKKRKINSKF